MNKYTKWFVLEYPKQTKEIVDFVHRALDDSEFLYADTLHIYNENQTLEEMFYEMAKQAKTDIDDFFDTSESKIEIKISVLKKQLKELNEFQKNHKINTTRKK